MKTCIFLIMSVVACAGSNHVSGTCSSADAKYLNYQWVEDVWHTTNPSRILKIMCLAADCADSILHRDFHILSETQPLYLSADDRLNLDHYIMVERMAPLRLLELLEPKETKPNENLHLLPYAVGL